MPQPKAGLAERLPPPEWLSPRAGPAAGMRLAFRAYPAPGGPAWVHVLVSHGLGEHCGWWQHVALALQARGISAYLFDHFHHGQSAGTAADASSYDVLAAGLQCALEDGVLPRAGGAPVVLLGHSNGGLVGLWTLPRIAGRLRGLVLCSPLIQLRWVQRWLGMIPAWVLARIDPGLFWPAPPNPRTHTSDASLWPMYFQDPLRFRKISVRFYLAMRAACTAVEARTDVGGLPLLLLAAGGERIVDRAAMLRWFGRVAASDKTLLDHPGMEHEIFHEQEWQIAVNEVVSWLEQRFPKP